MEKGRHRNRWIERWVKGGADVDVYRDRWGKGGTEIERMETEKDKDSGRGESGEGGRTRYYY